MLERGDRLTVAVTHAACMLRTFGLQCGVAALAACLLARLMGMKRLALVALLIAGVWLVPEAWKWKRSPAQGETGSEKLTVLSVNALFGRASVESIVRLAAACDADVVVVQEYTPRLEGALRPALSGYPYRVEMARDDGFGEAVFSRRPLVGESRVYPAAPMKWSSQPQI
ncbi:MAG TPA: endonuclease/exonuclease/phosphatase family protein, partial [Phycisphaerales bacterium]|nr:endonuclease/exonuclease/phosphatase family protein [Phycisphaerales bacterium]